MLNTIHINLKTDIKTDSPTVLPIKLMSQDINNNRFILRFTNGGEDIALDDTYTVEVLSKFAKSGSSRLTTAKVRQVYATWEFDTAYIVQDETVYNYVYVRKSGSLVVSADSNAFHFEVGLSEIDKDVGKVAEIYDENYQKHLDEFKDIVDSEEIAQSEAERIQAEQARKEAEILREESYEQKVDTALVEADVVEKIDNKVTELTPMMNELTDQLAQTKNEVVAASDGEATLKNRLDRDIQTTENLLNTKSNQYNVDVKKDFGALGNGISDDTIALQSAINSIGVNGGEVYIPNGIYRITNKLNLINPLIAQPNKLVIRGESYKNVILRLDNLTASAFLDYDNGSSESSSGVSYHSLTLLNLILQNTSSQRHPGVGLRLNGTRFSEFVNINVENFEEGIYSFRGWMNRFDTLYVRSCTKGMTLQKESYETELFKPQFYLCGISATGEGYSLLIKDTGGVVIVGLLLEDSRAKGLIIDNVQGLVINGGNVETFSNNHSIYVQASNYLLGDRSKGITITGIRFWRALGVRIFRGAENVKINNNVWLHQSGDPVNATRCINTEYSSDGYLYIRNIDYAHNSYGGEGYTPTLHSNLTANNGYATRSFTMDGKRYAAVNPNAHGNLAWGESDIVYASAPATVGYVGWVFAGGTFVPFGALA